MPQASRNRESRHAWLLACAYAGAILLAAWGVYQRQQAEQLRGWYEIRWTEQRAAGIVGGYREGYADALAGKPNRYAAGAKGQRIKGAK